MVIQEEDMEDDDLEALRLAALQTIKPRKAKNVSPVANKKGPFFRLDHNPNLIAIVPSIDIKTDVSTTKRAPVGIAGKVESRTDPPKQLPTKQQYAEADSRNDEEGGKSPLHKENSPERKKVKIKFKRDDEDTLRLDEDELDFESEDTEDTISQTGEGDELVLHANDEDSLEKLMDEMEQEFSEETLVPSPPRDKSSQAPPSHRKKSPAKVTSGRSGASPPLSSSHQSPTPPSQTYRRTSKSPLPRGKSPLSSYRPSSRSPLPVSRRSPLRSRRSRSPLHRRSKSPRRSPISRRGSPLSYRSPRRSPLRMTHRKSRSRTPPRREYRSRSPKPRRYSKSPSYRRSLSPVKRRFVRRSPSPRRRSISPNAKGKVPLGSVKRRSPTPPRRKLSPSPPRRRASPLTSNGRCRRRSNSPSTRRAVPPSRARSPLPRTKSPLSKRNIRPTKIDDNKTSSRRVSPVPLMSLKTDAKDPRKEPTIPPLMSLARDDIKNKLVTTSDNETTSQQKVDPKLLARRKKFESNNPIGPVNKKICLRTFKDEEEYDTNYGGATKEQFPADENHFESSDSDGGEESPNAISNKSAAVLRNLSSSPEKLPDLRRKISVSHGPKLQLSNTIVNRDVESNTRSLVKPSLIRFTVADAEKEIKRLKQKRKMKDAIKIEDEDNDLEVDLLHSAKKKKKKKKSKSKDKKKQVVDITQEEGDLKSDLQTQDGDDLRAALMRRRAERSIKGQAAARLVQSAFQDVVGKKKSLNTMSSVRSKDCQSGEVSRLQKPVEGRRVHVVENLKSNHSSDSEVSSIEDDEESSNPSRRVLGGAVGLIHKRKQV